ncbi:unnamed protein product [Adineta steineri]|uniref:CCHC-type domain-containing protein n=1 Tax=Adineta steineri TaxID=433720 RepID=A0A815FT45_9BILA|nr:unnamed protein product [Adineta steineri]CAF1330576.1 unnamed protein product [Adineta steineri]
MDNYNINSKLMTDIRKNGDVTGKSINVPLSTGFNQQKCQCQHSINVESENVLLNSSSISHQHASTSGTTEVQLVISPTRPSRRCRSNASNDGDFQDVSYKKSKQINNQSDSTIRPQLLHYHNGNDTVNDNVNMNLNVNNHVTTTSSVISNNFTTGHNQQQQLLTTASARYALTRFPFPPHIVRFKSTNVSITYFKAEVVKHYKSDHNLNIEIISCRRSTIKCNNNEMDVLLYVKDSTSFAALLDHSKWPLMICGEQFIFPSVPSIPPQLSLIIKNVDIHLDFDEFSLDLKNLYPSIQNVIRMKNKFSNDIKMVKLELTCAKARDDLLNNKLVYVNYSCYEIEEYIAPVNVLICSKCCSIGHFRRQCTEQDETCKSCGQSFKDLKMHHCSSIIKCKHCNGDHLSNSMKCPVVKTFRADLTKKLMNINNNVTSYSSSIAASIANNNTSQHINNDFPRTAAPWAPSSNPMDLKLNTLISGLSQVNETLSKLCVTNQGFQQFMIEKNENDKRINIEIADLKSINNKMDQDVMVLNEKVNDLDKLMKSNDGIFKQFLFPMLDDVLKFIDTKNVGRGGKTVDPDLKSKIDRFRNQMSDAMDGKSFI